MILHKLFNNIFSSQYRTQFIRKEFGQIKAQYLMSSQIKILSFICDFTLLQQSILACTMMEVEDQQSIKTQQEVKRQNNSNANRAKVQNIPEDDQGYIQLSSEQSQRQNTYKRQRDEMSQKNIKVIDLNKEILSGLVRLCRDNNLIDQELAHCFFANHTTQLETLYIQCYRTNQLHRYDFSKSKISIVDHRRLAQMLIQSDPEKYIAIKPQGPYDYLKEGREFLKEIYALSSQHYEQLIQTQVNRFYQSWWGGPQNLNPLPIEPLVKILDPQETKRILQQRESALRSQRMEEEKTKSKKTNQNPDLIEIAKYLSSQLFGNKEKEVKVEQQQQQQERESVSQRRKKKEKDRKQKDKKKRKKHKKDDEIKQQEIEAKFEQESIQEIRTSKKKKQK